MASTDVTPSNASALDIPKLFSDYLRGPGAVRNELSLKYPLLFTTEMVAALDSAVAQLAATRGETSEVVQAIEGIRVELDLPDDGSLSALQPEERRQLQDPEAMLELFASHLAQLLASAQATGTHGVSASSVQGPTGSVSPAKEGTDTGAEGGTAVAATWHQTPALVLSVLSYLTIEEVLTTAEDVCRGWRYWLFQPEFSKYFWIEAVQREYPMALGQLIQTQGSDIMHSDWRTIAMLVCTAESDEDEDGGACGSG